MTDVSQVINVTVNVGDVQVTAEGFGTPLVFMDIEPSVFTERVRTYTSLLAAAVDFASTTKTYKAIQAIFAQERAPSRVKVGRREVADASDSAAIDAILAEDSDWYCLVTQRKTKSQLQAIAAKIETLRKICLVSSEDSDVLTSATTDVATALKAAGYNRTAYMHHHQAGVDVTGAIYNVSSGVATITQTNHGLRVGDKVTFFASSGSSINGDNTVVSVPSANSFTVATTAADVGGSPTVSYYARYTFPECAWAGSELSSDPGSETWKFKQLAGITPQPSNLLSPAQETRALGKNANLYTTLGGVGYTHEGIMASGRFIDVQRGIDWLDSTLGTELANLLLNSPKIPYTDAGGTVLEATIASVLNRGVDQGLLGPLLDGSGRFYVIGIPKVASQLESNRAARHFPGITVQAQLAGAVHSLAITVNAQI